MYECVVAALELRLSKRKEEWKAFEEKASIYTGTIDHEVIFKWILSRCFHCFSVLTPPYIVIERRSPIVCPWRFDRSNLLDLLNFHNVNWWMVDAFKFHCLYHKLNKLMLLLRPWECNNQLDFAFCSAFWLSACR